MDETGGYLGLNFKGLVSFTKSELVPLFDVKHQNTSTELVGLNNSWNKKQLQPITICFIEGKPFILDGVQRWKLSSEDKLILCYSLGNLSEYEAILYWFQLDNVIGVNILKMSDLVGNLDINTLMEIAVISKLSLPQLMDLKTLKEFDFEAFIKKFAEKTSGVQTSLF